MLKATFHTFIQRQLINRKTILWKVLSWSWSYGSWIYIYLCNQCLSPLKLWVWIPLRGGVYPIQHYVIKFVSDLWQDCGFLRWNIVGSGIKHHNPKPYFMKSCGCFVLSYVTDKWKLYHSVIQRHLTNRITISRNLAETPGQRFYSNKIHW